MKQIDACGRIRSGRRWQTGPISSSDFNTLKPRSMSANDLQRSMTWSGAMS